MICPYVNIFNCIISSQIFIEAAKVINELFLKSFEHNLSYLNFKYENFLFSDFSVSRTKTRSRRFRRVVTKFMISV